jgi:hypothetical protein
MTKLKAKWRSYFSTVMGAVVAIATAWSTIDFGAFTFAKDWHMLIIPGLIALGGYLTKLEGEESNG